MKNISKNLIAFSFVFGLFALFGTGSAQAYYNYGSIPTYPARAMTATEYMYYSGTPVTAYQPVTYKRVETTPQYYGSYYYGSTTMVQPYQQIAYPTVSTQSTTPVVNNYYYGSTPSSSNTAKNTTSSTTKTTTTTKNTNTGNNSNGMVAAVQPRTNNLMASAADSYTTNAVYPYCYTGDYKGNEVGSNLTALSINGGGGFLPSSIWQWILAIMLILAIVVIARMIVKSNPHRDPVSTPIH
ncbi:TPA: hypothetical protein DIC38_01995 [Candidatus Nomurabacteria bacterium]|nr:MAG: hypothetical protein O210_OD1C00001G0331 [Parcubacteria bacterium RAAC4_OD1_1]HCY26429.1 hypothetical protein [Candidatus Nomurabacteria bacterium]